ncbi:hypothetical protein FB451DRAFT_767888 [Mycena latifolia]|nr:hypothetical protein FB451DRAFT_767888 [Mycena latifolia]
MRARESHDHDDSRHGPRHDVRKFSVLPLDVTPQSSMQAGKPSWMQPAPSGSQPFNLDGKQHAPIPPLDKDRFKTVYENFCTQRNLVPDPRMMSLEARSIDLYELHVQVMFEGGGRNLFEKDRWAVIGGRMGFVSFPASDTEPAKSDLEAAQHLAHVYNEYIAAFDNVYVNTVMESRRRTAFTQSTNVSRRPSREAVVASMEYVAKLKSDYSLERMLTNVPPVDVPAEEHTEYNIVLEQLYRDCEQLNHKLPMIHAIIKKEGVVRRLVIIVQTAVQQRKLISSSAPHFLVTLATLQTMHQQVQHMLENFATLLQELLPQRGFEEEYRSVSINP